MYIYPGTYLYRNDNRAVSVVGRSTGYSVCACVSGYSFFFFLTSTQPYSILVVIANDIILYHNGKGGLDRLIAVRGMCRYIMGTYIHRYVYYIIILIPTHMVIGVRVLVYNVFIYVFVPTWRGDGRGNRTDGHIILLYIYTYIFI